MNVTDKLSNHFTVGEVIASPTAEKYKINNEPSAAQWVRIKLLIEKVLEPTRVALGHPFVVNSIFRSKLLNQRVKGAGSSQHCANNGAAADIECPELGNEVLFNYLLTNSDFDQLIWEYGNNKSPDWVHISYVSPGLNRKQVLKCIADKNGNPNYISYKK